MSQIATWLLATWADGRRWRRDFSVMPNTQMSVWWHEVGESLHWAGFEREAQFAARYACWLAKRAQNVLT